MMPLSRLAFYITVLALEAGYFFAGYLSGVSLP